MRTFSRLALAGALLISELSLAARVEWINGHEYEPVYTPGGISWQTAQANAFLLGGYLATITSAAENAFAYSLVSKPDYWFFDGYNMQGPYLGGYQPSGSHEPGGGWTWLNGEGLFTFTAWASGEPNNYNGNEHFLQFMGSGHVIAPNWNDIPGAPYNAVKGYIIEWNPVHHPVPETAPSAWLLACTLVGLALLSRRWVPTPCRKLSWHRRNDAR